MTKMKIGGKLVIGIILLTLVIKTSSTTTALSLEDQIVNPLALDYNVHVPISITDDNDFISYGFTGTGEEETPYLIEGYNITTTGEKGIYITDTTKYFAIRDCYVNTDMRCIHIYGVAEGTALLINNICTKSGGGISLYASSGATIINNTCSNKGIYLRYSSGCTLTNNTCSNSYYGISLENSSNATLTNNTCSNNNYGISLRHSSGSTLTNNTCTNNNYGIYLEYSSGSTLTNNTCTNNSYGIYLWYSYSSTLINNTCNNNGICGFYLWDSSGSILINNTCYNNGFFINEDSVADYLNYTFENNWVNDKELGFYTNLEKLSLLEPLYGQLILINCTEMEVCNQELSNKATLGMRLYSCNNATLTNNTCSNNYYGISLENSSNATLTNNTCSNNWYGISLRYSSNATLTNNTCSNNNYGIYLEYSSGSTLTNNTCTNNGVGIYQGYSDSSTLANNTCSNNNNGISLENSSNATLTNNTCSNNWYGISLRYSSNATLTNNTCSNNYHGIYLRHSSGSTLTNNTCTNNYHGIYLEYSYSSTLANNTCSNNWYGISLRYSDSCLLTYNLLQENEEYGIYLGPHSDSNIIHHNYFIDNNLGGISQASDWGNNNIWYDTTTNEGNYWSDWSGTGGYPIDGSGIFGDPYPLDEEGNPPIISEFQQKYTFTAVLFLCLVIVPILFKKKRKHN